TEKRRSAPADSRMRPCTFPSGRNGLRGHDRPVMIEQPITHSLPRLPLQAGASMPTHRPSLFGVSSKPVHGSQQGPGALRRIEQSVAPVVDALEQTAGGGADDRNA